MYTSLELCGIILDNVSLSIVFYLEIKVEVEVGVHDIRSRFGPRYKLSTSNFNTTLGLTAFICHELLVGFKIKKWGVRLAE